MSRLKTIVTLCLTAITLAACTSNLPTSTQTTTDSEVVIESTGDAQQDAALIEKELNSLNEATDFPDIKESDFSL